MLKSRAECLQQYGSDYMIQKKLKNGELYEVGKAVYSEKKHVPEIAVLAYKHPNAVITMRSAFYLHNLTDVIPDEYDLATDRNAAKIKDDKVKQYFVPADFFEKEIETVDYKGYPVRVYSKERMLIELLRFKNKFPFDYYKEIIGNYRNLIYDLDIERIQDYAETFPRSKMITDALEMEVF